MSVRGRGWGGEGWYLGGGLGYMEKIFGLWRKCLGNEGGHHVYGIRKPCRRDKTAYFVRSIYVCVCVLTDVLTTDSAVLLVVADFGSGRVSGIG